MVTDRVSAIFTYLDEEAFDQFTESTFTHKI